MHRRSSLRQEDKQNLCDFNHDNETPNLVLIVNFASRVLNLIYSQGRNALCYHEDRSNSVNCCAYCIHSILAQMEYSR